jgi:Sulfotransferase domain
MIHLFRLPAELVPMIPTPVRVVARGAVRGYGRATAAVRPLPDFLVIGAQKAGTTALYAYLRWHPAITGPSWKEVSFFDRHYARGEAWYRGNFPARPRQWVAGKRSGARPRVGEASPSYLFHPLAPERVAGLLPDVRLIALLRDPVDRALSHYHHEVALGREPLTFEDALDREDERLAGEVDRMKREPSYFSEAWWNYTYLARGRYAEQLERWLTVLPRDRLLVVFAEELLADPAAEYKRVLDFLGVPRHELPAYPRIFSRDYAPMAPATRRRVEESFAEPNRRLARLLGRELPWQAATG